MRSFFISLVALLPLFACEADADEAAKDAASSIYDLTLKELMSVTVVTAASGFEQSLNRAPSNATVITKEQWQARGAYTLSQALESVAGVHITKPLVNFNHNLYMIRGLSGTDGEQVKLLIDGHPLEWMQTSGRPLGFDMPIHMFERIEVVKGPGSAIYGADAFAGVINLVSHKGNKVKTTVNSSVGQFGTYGMSFLHGWHDDEYEVNVALDYRRSDDDPGRVVTSDLQTIFDGLFGSQASNAPGPIDEHYEVLSLMTNWRWRDWSLDYHTWRNFDIGIGAGVSQALDNKGYASAYNDRITLEWDLADWVDEGRLKLSSTYNKGHIKSLLYVFPQGSMLPIGADGNVQFSNPTGFTFFPDGLIGTPSNIAQTHNIKLTRLNRMGKHQLRWELGYEYHDVHFYERKNFGPGVLDGTQSEVDDTLFDVTGTQWVYIPDSSRRFYYLSVLDEWDISSEVIMNFGLRYDRYSDFGSTINPRVSVIYQPISSLTAKVFAGTAFRAPSFAELYVRNNPVLAGNPDLGPEGVNTTEVGLALDYWLNDDLQLSLDLFNYYADDLVDFVFDPELGFEIAQNVGVQKGLGGEFELKYKPRPNISMNFNYSYTDSENRQGNPLAGVPQTMIYFDFHYRFESLWRWYIDAKWIKGRDRDVTDIRGPIADYYRVNTTLSYAGLAEGLTLSLAMRNLFDRDAREPSDGSIVEDFPLAGRQWMLTMSYDF